jgi:hypothetical protein
VTDMDKVNWLAVISGILTLVLAAVSMYVPWWQLTIGNGTPTLAQANFSPVNLNMSILGSPLTIPLIWAINIASLLSLAAGAIILLIYAIRPNKPYSKKLLGFGYNKPLFAVILFAAELIIITVVAGTFAGFQIPLTGSAMLNLPQSMTQGNNVAVTVYSSFGWPFYFAIVVAGLAVAARLYHRKVASPDPPSLPN